MSEAEALLMRIYSAIADSDTQGYEVDEEIARGHENLLNDIFEHVDDYIVANDLTEP